MKILYCITRSNWGGAQAHLFDLVSELSKKDIQCEVVIGEKGLLYERLEKIGVKVHYLKNLTHRIAPIKDIKAIIGLKRIIQQFNPDIIHLHSTKAGWVGRISSYLTRKKVIFTAHGWCFTEGASTNRRTIGIIIERALGRITNKVICVSKYDESLALKEKVISSEQVITIHNGVCENENEELIQSDKNDAFIKVVMVARFAPPKDQETLIRAVTLLESGINVYFVGDGPNFDNAKQLVRDLGIEKKVFFLGEQRNVEAILKQSDIFVLLTFYEGLPISIIEAMKAGLPIIATNVGGVPELVKEGENGYIIAKQDADIAAKYVNELAVNATKRQVLGVKSKEIFKKLFTLKACVEKTFELYENVLKEAE